MQARVTPGPRLPVWHGSSTDAAHLLSALASNCTCALDDRGARLKICPAHSLVLTDQRALDGLLFGRYLAQRLQAEEFVGAAPPAG
jgi:hypothetical protein